MNFTITCDTNSGGVFETTIIMEMILPAIGFADILC
jgi:hypothetical protein